MLKCYDRIIGEVIQGNFELIFMELNERKKIYKNSNLIINKNGDFEILKG